MATYTNIIPLMSLDDQGKEVESKVHPTLAPLLNELALKYPQWTFKCNSAWTRYNGERMVRAFGIFEKRESIGSVGIEASSNGRDMVFCIQNERIGHVRTRSDTVKTKDIKRAAATVKKFVNPKTLVERFYEKRTKADDVLATVRRSKFAAVSNAERPMHDLKHKFLEANVRLFVESLDPAGLELMAKLTEAKQELVACDTVTNAWSVAGDSVLVSVYGQDYTLSDSSDSRVGIVGHSPYPSGRMSSEELPEHIRTAIGMLKLVQPTQIIEGMGMRVDEESFIVTRKKDD